MKLKFFLIVILFVISSVFCVDSGNNSDEEPSQLTTLSFLVPETDAMPRELWQIVTDRYNAQNPNVSINIIYTPNKNISVDDYIKTLLEKNDLPDIFITSNHGELVSRGALLPLENSDVSMLDDAYKYTYGGEIYVVPHKVEIGGVWYNKDMFAQNNYDIPTSWAEFRDISLGFQESGITPNVIALNDRLYHEVAFSCIQTAMLLKNDASWPLKRMSGNDTFWRNEDFLSGVEVYQMISNNFNVSNKRVLTYSQGEQAFLKGETAMYIMGSWVQNAIIQENPNFEVGFFPFPAFDGETIIPVWIDEGLAISANTEYPDICKDFIRFFLEDENFASQFLASEQLVSPLKNPVTYEANNLHEEIRSYVLQSRKIVNFYGQVGDNFWGEAGKKYISNAVFDIASGKNKSTAISTLDRGFNYLVENK